MSSEADEELRSTGVWIVRSCHRQNASDVWSCIELRLDRVSWAASAGAKRASALNHEATDDSMECDAVVITDLCEPDHVGTVPRSNIRKKIERDLAMVCIQLNLIVVCIKIDVFDGCCDFGLTILGH